MNNDFKNIYPVDFDDEMKKQYDILYKQAKLIHSDAEDWTIKMALEAYIRAKGEDVPKISPEEILKMKSRYDTNVEYTTEVDESQFIYQENKCSDIDIKIAQKPKLIQDGTLFDAETLMSLINS